MLSPFGLRLSPEPLNHSLIDHVFTFKSRPDCLLATASQNATSPPPYLSSPTTTRMPQLLEMSHDQYTAIRRFIVRHIQDQDFPEDDGIPGQVLIHLCLERFYPEAQDPQDTKTEKKSIEGAIRHMVEDFMLQPVNKNQKIVFRLDPYFNIKDKMNPSASQPSEDPQSTQEALDALEKETSPDIEDEEMDQQMDEELAQQLDEPMNQTEEEQEDRAEEVGHDSAEREQEDQTEEDINNGAETYQEKQDVEVEDNRVGGHQDAQQAARLEATSGALPIALRHSMLIAPSTQDMQKLTLK
jgi:hypothetical protein